jgi:hypothetical protein
MCVCECVCVCVCMCVCSVCCKERGCEYSKRRFKWLFLSITWMYQDRVIGQNRTYALFLGLARTIYIRCIYGILGREITKYTVIYGVCIRFWPTLLILYRLFGHFLTKTTAHTPYIYIWFYTYTTHIYTTHIYHTYIYGSNHTYIVGQNHIYIYGSTHTPYKYG